MDGPKGLPLTRAERKGVVQVGKAITLLGDVMSTRPDLEPYLTLIPRAVDLSSTLRTGVYDCLDIALAEREHCKVVTADQHLLMTSPEQTVSLDSL
jgi:predicted nucleic acid-binding protein